MQSLEIVLPSTEPETEWVRGRALPKVSPTARHALVQTHLAVVLAAWAKGRGLAATEWRFRIQPPGEAMRPLVPDVAFVARAFLRGRTMDDLDAPPFAPTAAFEVLSPGDAAVDVTDKIDVYLRGGSEVVVVADPIERIFVLHDASGIRTLRDRDEFEHPALPGLRFSVGPFFTEALDSEPLAGS